jgi:hypothetical protein
MEATIAFVSLWHIWDARNKTREEDIFLHPRVIAEKALAYVRMIDMHLYKLVYCQRRETTSSVPKWSPPPAGMVLVNFDAAVFNSSSSMGAGVVIRDNNGNCLAACNEKHHEVATPEIAEAVAMRRAIVFAKDEGFTDVILASNCQSLVSRDAAREVDRSSCGPIVQDIRTIA